MDQVVGRAWQAGTVTAEIDLEHAADYPLLAAAGAAALLSAVALPVVAGGEVGGVIELVSDVRRTPDDDLVTMLATAGVEIGQFIALAVMLVIMVQWRRTASFERFAVAANALILTAGFILMEYQLAAYFGGAKVSI